MDIETIDQQYQQLQTQAQGTVQEIRSFAEKLQAAAQAGNQDARGWLLDLKSIEPQGLIGAAEKRLSQFSQGQVITGVPPPNGPEFA